MDYKEILREKYNNTLNDSESSDFNKKTAARALELLDTSDLTNLFIDHFYTMFFAANMTLTEFMKFPIYTDVIKGSFLKVNNDPNREFLDKRSIFTIYVNGRSYVELFNKFPILKDLIKYATYEQMLQFINCAELMELFDNEEFYNFMVKRAQDDERFYILFPINNKTIDDGFLAKIVVSGTVDEKEIFELDDEHFRKVVSVINADNINTFRRLLYVSNPEYADKYQILYSNKVMAKFVLSNPNSYCHLTSEKVKALLDNNEDLISNLAFKDKLEILKNITDADVQREFIEKINILYNLVSLDGFKLTNFFKSLVDKKYATSLLIEDMYYKRLEEFNLGTAISDLGVDNQRALFNDPEFRKYFNSISSFYQEEIISSCDYEIMQKIYSSLPSISIDKALALCKAHYDENNFALLKKALSEDESIDMYDLRNINNILTGSDKFLSKLSLEDFKYLVDFSLSHISADNVLIFYSLLYCEDEVVKERVKYFKELYANKLVECISKLEGRCISDNMSSIAELLSPEQKIILLDHFNIESLISNCFSDDVRIKYLYDYLSNGGLVPSGLNIMDSSYSHFLISPEYIKYYIGVYNLLPEEYRCNIVTSEVLDNPEIKNDLKNLLYTDPAKLISNSNLYEKILYSLSDSELREFIMGLSYEQLAIVFPNYIEQHTFHIDNKEQEKNDYIESLFLERKEEICKIGSTSGRYTVRAFVEFILKCFPNVSEGLDLIDVKYLIDSYPFKKHNDIIMEHIKNNINELPNCPEISEFLNRIKVDEINQLIENASLDVLFNMFALSSNKYLEERLMEEFKKRPYVDNKTKASLEEVISLLDIGNQDIVNSEVDKAYNSLVGYDEIKSKFRNVSIRDKMFLLVFDNEIGKNPSKLELISKLLSSNPFALRTLNVHLFDDGVFEVSKSIIPIISRYDEISRAYINILNKDQAIGRLVVRLIDHLNVTEKSENVLSKKLSTIITFFEGKDSINYSLDEVNSLSEADIASILEHLSKDNIDHLVFNEVTLNLFSDYSNSYDFKQAFEDERLAKEELDGKIASELDLDKLKDLIFKKLFSLDYEKAKSLLNIYSTSINDIERYLEASSINLYNFIKSLVECNDVAKLKSYAKLYEDKYYVNDLLYMNNDFNLAYNTYTNNNLKGIKNGKKETKTITIEGKTVTFDVIHVADETELFAHSTCAYGSMQMINGNYFDSWNYSDRTTNNGICTAFVSENNLGFPRVTGNGVMFGFYNIGNDSIVSMAPYDIASRNDSIDFTSVRPSMYMVPKDLSSYIRHTHSETVIKRRVDNGEYPVREPDCIIIFEEMEPKLKENALKARSDFLEHGIDLPIVYINREEIIRKQGNDLTKALDEFNKSYDLTLLSAIINRYESVRCGVDFDAELDINGILCKDRIYTSMLNMITLIKETDNRELAINFIGMLNFEEHKFTLIEESVGERAHKFDLLDPNMLEAVNDLNNSVIKSAEEDLGFSMK